MITFRSKEDCDPCPICNKHFSVVEKPNYISVWKFICSNCSIELCRQNLIYFLNENIFYEAKDKYFFGGDDQDIKFLNKESPDNLKEKLIFAKKYFQNIIFK